MIFSNKAIEGILLEYITHYQQKLFGETAVRYNHTSTRMFKIETTDCTKCSHLCEGNETLIC